MLQVGQLIAKYMVGNVFSCCPYEIPGRERYDPSPVPNQGTHRCEGDLLARGINVLLSSEKKGSNSVILCIM